MLQTTQSFQVHEHIRLLAARDDLRELFRLRPFLRVRNERSCPFVGSILSAKSSSYTSVCRPNVYSRSGPWGPLFAVIMKNKINQNQTCRNLHSSQVRCNLLTFAAYCFMGLCDSKNNIRAASLNAIFSYAFSIQAAISSLQQAQHLVTVCSNQRKTWSWSLEFCMLGTPWHRPNSIFYTIKFARLTLWCSGECRWKNCSFRPAHFLAPETPTKFNTTRTLLDLKATFIQLTKRGSFQKKLLTLL